MTNSIYMFLQTLATLISVKFINGVCDIKQQLVNQHNIIRKAHNLNEIMWDYQLASKMQQWASTCPGFKHGGPSGFQNLATYESCSGNQCLKQLGAAWMWYNAEETKWNYNTNKCSGSWAECGHFSNMMCPSVKSIGCGWSECGGAYGGRYVWCNYNGGDQNPVIPKPVIPKEQLKTALTSGGNLPSTVPTPNSPVVTPFSSTTLPVTKVPTPTRSTPIIPSKKPCTNSVFPSISPYPTTTPSNYTPPKPKSICRTKLHYGLHHILKLHHQALHNQSQKEHPK